MEHRFNIYFDDVPFVGNTWLWDAIIGRTYDANGVVLSGGDIFYRYVPTVVVDRNVRVTSGPGSLAERPYTLAKLLTAYSAVNEAIIGTPVKKTSATPTVGELALAVADCTGSGGLFDGKVGTNQVAGLIIKVEPDPDAPFGNVACTVAGVGVNGATISIPFSIGPEARNVVRDVVQLCVFPSLRAGSRGRFTPFGVWDGYATGVTANGITATWANTLGVGSEMTYEFLTAAHPALTTIVAGLCDYEQWAAHNGVVALRTFEDMGQPWSTR